jgi:transcriptional regulator with XRE-family HTH domain
MGEIVRIDWARQQRKAPLEPLWREVLGRRLRMLRLEQHAKLSDIAHRAGISPQYLSEIERGRKEPSSEMIAAVAGALGLTLVDLTLRVADDLRAASGYELHDLESTTATTTTELPTGHATVMALAA